MMPTPPVAAANCRIVRLGAADRDLAKRLFGLMADVFEEEHEELADADVDDLLAREGLWALAAFSGDALVGGLTAHTLPMTRTRASEVFIYDLAVPAAHQRRGIGRALVRHLLDAAAALGIGTAFVGADDADLHALEFYRALGGDPAPVTIFTFTRTRDAE